MGLDMYAFAVEEKKLSDVDRQTNVDVNLSQLDGLVRVFYWRKHHDLHGWMNQLYKMKGGTNPDFNGNTVRLFPDDLDRLEKDLKEHRLPETSGFFFGHFPPDEDSLKDDLLFIEKARQLIYQGHAVFYDSWW